MYLVIIVIHSFTEDSLLKLGVLFAAAAEIAVDLMWQEDFSHALCRMLSWRACHLRLAELLAIPTPEVTEEQEPEAPAAEDEEVIILSRAVPNIRFVFASAPNSGPNRLFVFGRIVLPRLNTNSERLFSMAGDTFSDTRSCLHADNMERLIFLKANLSFMG